MLNVAKNLFITTVIAAGLLFAAGCQKSKIVVRVNEDGSGHIIVSEIYPKSTVAMVDLQMAEMRKNQEKMKKQFEEQDMEMPEDLQQVPDDPFYNEDALKRMAGYFGPGVSFVNAKRYEKNGAKGAVALYKFDDINKIFIDPDMIMENMVEEQIQMQAGEEDEDMQVAERTPQSIGFAMAGEDDRKLTVNIPEYPEVELPDVEDGEDNAFFNMSIPAQQMEQMMGDGNPLELTGDETQGDLIKRFMEQLEMSLEVEIPAGIAQTNARHIDPDNKNRIGIYKMDMGPALEKEPKVMMKMMENLQKGSDDNFVKFLALMNHLPGTDVETQQTVTVTFD